MKEGKLENEKLLEFSSFLSALACRRESVLRDFVVVCNLSLCAFTALMIDGHAVLFDRGEVAG
jgi:hypothetical protein